METFVLQQLNLAPSEYTSSLFLSEGGERVILVYALTQALSATFGELTYRNYTLQDGQFPRVRGTLFGSYSCGLNYHKMTPVQLQGSQPLSWARTLALTLLWLAHQYRLSNTHKIPPSNCQRTCTLIHRDTVLLCEQILRTTQFQDQSPRNSESPLIYPRLLAPGSFLFCYA